MELLKVSELAARVGVLPSTIRYYRDLGLVAPVGKTRGGFHLYDEQSVTRAHAIRRLQREQRMTLDEIAEHLQTRVAS
jgi:DNA-binding transcriptional MerR regulator